MSVSEAQFKLIQEELKSLEVRENITILWASESGSRAWGFESTDSDYDVRFIYLRSSDDYLKVSPTRDVIELPISEELDISGWDLTKALGLLRKSNPALLEWLQSPIVYQEQAGFRDSFWTLCQEYFCQISCTYHYSSMAKRNCRSYLEADTIRLKRYFYMLRPILSTQWLRERGEIAPMQFETLVNELVPDGKIKKLINDLIERKRSGVELGEAPVIPELSAFILEKMECFKGVKKNTEITTPWLPLDNYFRETLKQSAK